MSRRNSDLPIWNFFEKPIDGSKRATCNYCRGEFSFRTSITNLKQHLKQKHITVYNNLINFGKTLESTALKTVSNIPLSKFREIEGLHVENVGDENRNTACSGVGETRKFYYVDSDQNSDEASNADDNETYTEIVYLEQDPVASKPKHTVKNEQYVPKSPKKRQRNDSDDELPMKRIKEQTHKETDELGAFIQYISVLLKKLPQDVFSKVQIEIINTILKANMASERRIVNEVNGNSSLNVISLSEMAPVTDSGHNYTITVKPNESDNVSLS